VSRHACNQNGCGSGSGTGGGIGGGALAAISAAAAGYPTLRLVRWKVGDWTLAGLAPGEWREA